MDITDIASRYGKTTTAVQATTEIARRSLVPRTRSFTITEQGRRRSLAVTREGVGPLNTDLGHFHHFAFALDDEWQKYSVLVMAKLDDTFTPVFEDPDHLMLRIDSGCETGQVFGDLTCECRQQLQLCMKQIQQKGEGMIVHIPRQDGRGLGLPFKLATLRLQADLNASTIEASALLDPNGSRDTRTYAGVVAILQFLGIPKTTKLYLGSNNPQKAAIFPENEYSIAGLVPVVIPPTPLTRRHLEAKQAEFGHINLIPSPSGTRSAQGPRAWTSRIRSSIATANSRVCCGLDPDVSKLPVYYNWILPLEERVVAFLKEVIDITASSVCAYKAQKAFFDSLDHGKRALREVVAYVHERSDKPVIIDCKIGDIDNTMIAYIDTLFRDVGADAIVVNPYMGSDVWAPFRSIEDKAAFVLTRTSNLGSDCVQDVRLADGSPFWKHILRLVIEEWNAGTNVMPILSSNAQVEPTTARELLSHGLPILVAGFGEQGGKLDNVSSLLTSTGAVFFNASRSLLYPYSRDAPDWRDTIRSAVVSMRDEINSRIVDTIP